jgi:tRNA threonylcarbamoyladenosine biosynthesis protein TsaB
MLLAIDTATHLAALALLDMQGVRGAVTWQTQQNHTVELLPNIVALLKQADVTTNDLQAIAVAIGPGSYTGLRIGLSVAKGFCFAHNAALIGIPTLDISAHAYEPRATQLCAVLQAGRGRLGAQCYRAEQGVWRAWRATGAHFLGRAEELAATITQPTFFVGELDAVSESSLRERLGALATFAPEAERARDPRVLARLAYARWQRGEHDDVTTLAPFYG